MEKNYKTICPHCGQIFFTGTKAQGDGNLKTHIIACKVRKSKEAFLERRQKAEQIRKGN